MMPRRKRRFASRIRHFIRSLLAFLFSNVGVIVLVVGYTIAGAFMFQAIEGGSEREQINQMAVERDNTVQYLWQNVTLALNIFDETALKQSISVELQKYQRKIVIAVRKGWDGERTSRQWSFSSAFLYSLTVITTIGYGHLAPRTNWGKIVTIMYTLLGMPLFLLYLTNVGQLLASWFKCVYALLCLCRGCPGFGATRNIRFPPQLDVSEVESIERPESWGTHSEVSEEGGPGRNNLWQSHQQQRRAKYNRSTSMPNPRSETRFSRMESNARGWSEPVHCRHDDSQSSEFSIISFDAQTITVPLTVCVFIMVGYLIFGSMIFGIWEKWDLLDGSYFCFISLSSIGFGDFVPGERVYTPRLETSFIVCSMYLMLGMALVAMCFNLMQEQVIHYCAAMKRAIKRISRCKR